MPKDMSTLVITGNAACFVTERVLFIVHA